MYTLRYLPGSFKDGKKIGYCGNQKYTITNHKEKVPGLCKKVYSEYWLWTLEEPIEENIFPLEIENLIREYLYPKYMLRNTPYYKDDENDQNEYEEEERFLKEEIEERFLKEEIEEIGQLMSYPEHLREYILNNDCSDDMGKIFECGKGYFKNPEDTVEGIRTYISLFPEKHSEYLDHLLNTNHNDEYNTIEILEFILELDIAYKGSPYTCHNLKTYWTCHEDATSYQIDEKVKIIEMLKKKYPITDRDKAYILPLIDRRDPLDGSY